MFSHKNKLKLIFCILFADFLLSVYFGCMVSSIFSVGETIVVNPFKVFSWIGRHGFPSVGFTISFLIIGVLAIIVFFEALLSGATDDVIGRKFQQPTKRQTYGDAHFEEPEEYKNVATIKPPETAYGPILGQLDETGRRLIVAYTKKVMGNGHMAVFGQSGYGKSYTFTKPLVMQCKKRRESMIISDPDGGLEKDLRGYLINAGYVVRTLNLKDFGLSNGWDCLKSVAHENPEIVVSRIQIFTTTCLENTFSSSVDRGSIYFSGPLQLFQALVMRVWFGQDFKPEEKNLKTVISLLNHPEIEDFLDALFDESRLETEDEKRCLSPWRVFLASSKNLKGNLIANLGSMLGVVLASNALSTLLSTDELDLELPGDQPCAYFCQAPDMHSAYKFVVSLFFSMVMQCLADKADRSPKGQLRVPVNFILDEFAAIGTLPDWDKKMAVVRKRRINVIMIFQNVTQLQNNYEKAWLTILSNCDIWMSLAVNDPETATMLQQRIGTTTVRVQTESTSPDENLIDAMMGHRKSSGEGKRDLLSLDEIMKLDPNKELVLIAHHNPIIAVKYPYVNHPDASLTEAPDPFGPLPPMKDKDARAARMELEAAFLEEYYNRHPNELVNKEEVRPADPATTKAVIRGDIIIFRNKVKEFFKRLKKGDNAADALSAARGKVSERIEDYEEIVLQGDGGDESDKNDVSDSSPASANASVSVDPSTGEIIEATGQEEEEDDGPCVVTSNSEVSGFDLDEIFSEDDDDSFGIGEDESRAILAASFPSRKVNTATEAAPATARPEQTQNRPPVKSSRPPAMTR